MLASTSKALWRTASSTPRLLRPLTTSSTPSPAPSSPSPTLPGFALPAAFRAPTTTPSSLPIPASNVVGPFRNRIAQGHPYKLHVFSSRNNTILTLSTSTADPAEAQRAVSWVSAGSAGYKGASRGTYDAAVEVALRMFKKIEEMVTPVVGSGGQRKKMGWAKPGELEVVWKGFGQGRDAVFRTLMGGEGDAVRPLVKTVTDAVSRVLGLARWELMDGWGADADQNWWNAREEEEGVSALLNRGGGRELMSSRPAQYLIARCDMGREVEDGHTPATQKGYQAMHRSQQLSVESSPSALPSPPLRHSAETDCSHSRLQGPFVAPGRTALSFLLSSSSAVLLHTSLPIVVSPYESAINLRPSAFHPTSKRNERTSPPSS